MRHLICLVCRNFITICVPIAATGRVLKQSVKVFHSLMLYLRLPGKQEIVRRNRNPWADHAFCIVIKIFHYKSCHTGDRKEKYHKESHCEVLTSRSFSVQLFLFCHSAILPQFLCIPKCLLGRLIQNICWIY